MRLGGDALMIGEARRTPSCIPHKRSQRRAKISAAKKGKPRPPHVIEAMRKGRLKKAKGG